VTLVDWPATVAVSESTVVLKEHERTTNRICWNPQEPNLLLSGSQDATIKLWVRHTVRGKGVLVRLVSFPPLRLPLHTCDGWLCTQDIRDPERSKLTLTPRSDSIRDMQFDPNRPSFFTAAFENGSVQVLTLSVSHARSSCWNCMIGCTAWVIVSVRCLCPLSLSVVSVRCLCPLSLSVVSVCCRCLLSLSRICMQ
jgi:WD40 repeat protein